MHIPIDTFIKRLPFHILPILFITLLMILATGCKSNTSGPAPQTEEQKESETEETPSEITAEEAVEVIIQVLQDRGLALPSDNASRQKDAPSAEDLSNEDYLTTDLNEEEERRVHFDLGPDGHIIPNSDWREANPNVCEDENRYMKGPTKRLQFKMFSVPGGYYAFIQYIDVETGKIEHQHEGESETLKKAINIAWDQLEVDIKAPTDPCGRLKGVTVFFNSRIKEVYDSTTIIEHVEAEFEVSGNAEGTYSGTGPITYIEINTSVDGSCTFPDGTLDIRELIFAMEGDTPADDFTLDIEYQNTINGGYCSGSDSEYVTTWPFNFTGMHMDEWIIAEDGESWEEGIIITGWEAVPGDDEIFARKVYDRTQTDDTGTLTEKTTIEIRQ